MTDRPRRSPDPFGEGDADAPGDAEDNPPSPYRDRIRDLAADARRTRERFDPPESGEADERALALCREGLGPAVACYVEVRVDERGVALSGEELRLLDRATNDWLDLYARCYGVDLEADFTVREAAELLVQTHDIREVALLLTRVPSR